MAVHILGIRHHGPGSARHVKDFLDAVKPDIVLVEGPPEADGLLQWVSHEALKPPVAILVYQPDDPQESSFYPFAEFSPEWQAILYAQTNKIPVRFMDLPAAHSFAIQKEIRAARQAAAEAAAAEAAANEADGDAKAGDEEGTRLQQGSPEESGAATSNGDSADTHFPLDPDHNMDISSLNNNAVVNSVAETDDTDFTLSFKHDPISHLAAAAGYEDGEKWWEHTFEHRRQSEQIFEAVGEAMHALREAMPSKESRMEQLREAYMRKCIRQAEREMFTNIVVICGAWHAPALQNMPKQKEDNDLLKGLPKVKTDCTWVPWTFGRLSFYSGYGAGIFSPGWYDHIWHYPDDDGTRWMAKVAQLFRSKGMDTSVAHVIEAVRLAESLAVLRQLPRAGLEELNEATWSVLCNGENMLLDLIKEELIVSNRIGDVPEDSPKPPLLLDIERTQKRLRLTASADWKDYTLDLRKENDLERSIFLHRLLLLSIRWGQQGAVTGKGTFKEQWRLQWQPEMSIDAIDKGSWGNTVSEAAEKYTLQKGKEASSLTEVCTLLEQAIPSELPLATAGLIHRINNLAAASGDVVQLMEVIPSLVSITRYGNVRKTDTELVLGIVDSMVTRICVSLPAATTAINEDAAQHLMELFFQLNDAVNLLQVDDITREWQEALQKIAASLTSAPVLGGYATRLLADRKILEGESLIRAFRYAMSLATAPAIAAAWLEGFLKGSGTILLIDQDLWNLVNDWVSSLGADTFTDVLPLLRRTFANYTQPERKKLGDKARTGSAGGSSSTATASGALDEIRGQQGIPVVLQLLGIKP